MLPPNPLAQLIPLRADSAVKRLQAAIWQDCRPLEVAATAAGPRLLRWEEARRLPRRRVNAGQCWGKLYDQRWCRVELPRRSRAGDWLSWQDEGEATLYVAGKPYFGFDVAHRHCRLPEGIGEVWVEANCVHSAIWHPESRGLSPQGSRFGGAFLCRRDEEAWHAWHDFKCLFDVALMIRQQENPALPPAVFPGCLQPAIEKHSPAFRILLQYLDEAADALDREGPAAARRTLAKAYEELRSRHSLMTAVLTGHAHIDLVWLWPERVGELKAVHTFATVNRLIEEYPEFRFAYSQPASYEAVRRRSKALADEVAGRMRSGQWQATGAMYVESDTLIACGEALLRSFLLGQEAFVGIRGEPARVTWLPDVFGYSACLPQMMRLAGVGAFFTTKLTWNMVNRFPYSSFIWRGNDGSEVVAHVTQDCGYNVQMEAAELKASSWGHQQGDIHREYLLPTGYGDGGGGPTAEMCERARRLSNLPGLPAMAWGHPEEFFARLADLREKLPIYQGECYLEGHRGTYTTHGRLKAVFRDLERALQVSEAVSCATGRLWDRSRVWRRMIFSQFHDYIPGSSIWEVYLDGLPELEDLAREQRDRAVKALSRPHGDPCVFNPQAVPVSRWWDDSAAGEPVFLRLPALSGMRVQDAVAARPDEVEIEGSTVRNGLVEFRVGPQGWIDELIYSGKTVPLRGPAGRLMWYRDQPARFEAWDLDRQTLAGGQVCAAPPKIEVFREGAHRAGFAVRRPVGNGNRAEVRFYAEAGSPLLHVRIDLEWTEPHALLKLLIPTQFAATQARFGTPFGSVLRPQTAAGPVAEAMWEAPFSRWLAVFDEGEQEGLFAIAENKYGATVRDGVIGLSLVRSPRVAGCDGLKFVRPPGLARVKAPSEYSDLGRHSLGLALGRYHGALGREAHPASLAETLFTDLLPYRGRPLASAIERIEGGESLIPAWAKPLARSGWILRLHEVSGRRGTIFLAAMPGWEAALCDALGQSPGSAGAMFRYDFRPYEIVSILLRRS